MHLHELLELLQRISQVHPEADHAETVFAPKKGNALHINYVAYDRRRKQKVIKLEE